MPTSERRHLARPPAAQAREDLGGVGLDLLALAAPVAALAAREVGVDARQVHGNAGRHPFDQGDDGLAVRLACSSDHQFAHGMRTPLWCKHLPSTPGSAVPGR